MLHGEIFVHDTSTLPLDPTAHCDGFREKRPLLHPLCSSPNFWWVALAVARHRGGWQL